MLGLAVVAACILAVALLPLGGFLLPAGEQCIDHASLPPSLLPAGELMLETRMDHARRLMEAQGRGSLTADEQSRFEQWRAEVRSDPVHRRHHWLGTDALGRDLLARVVAGGQVSLLAALAGCLAAALIGILAGAFSGCAGGWADTVLMRFVDILYGLPCLLIIIVVRAVSGQDNLALFIALALVSWLTVARVVRGQVLSLRNAGFVEAARSAGAGPLRIALRHLVPNTLGLAVVSATLMVPGFIMGESVLSFLGLGVSPPLASWGSLVADGVRVLEIHPWELAVPALALSVFLFALNFLGDGLRDAFDPQSRRKN
jgi:oligopeptide transport system permease protein